MKDTIVALVTAVGESSVGILRISGPDAFAIGNAVYKGKENIMTTESHRILYGHVYDDEANRILDEALFMVMRGPRSFTGEDVVEIQCHGGMVIIGSILQLVLRKGARLAEQGEFSKRAFLNGRLDLAQAESIMDLIQAKTEQGVDLALQQLHGGLSGQIQTMRANLLEHIAFIQADIDYPEDDIERLTNEEQGDRVKSILDEIERVLVTAKKGKMIRDGIRVVIAGKPNVGKSSLMNALLGQNRAIVTDIPGTTRDVIEEFINIGGIPVKLADTAGIRETENIVEQIGVDKAQELAQAADLVLYVLDGTVGLQAEDQLLLEQLEEKQKLFLLNKEDLGISLGLEEVLKKQYPNSGVLTLSAKEQIGLDRLEKAITDLCMQGALEPDAQVLVTNARHIQILEESRNHMKHFLEGISMGLSVDFLVIDLQNAWEKLGKITGETVAEDLLDQIFSKFCLGK